MSTGVLNVYKWQCVIHVARKGDATQCILIMIPLDIDFKVEFFLWCGCAALFLPLITCAVCIQPWCAMWATKMSLCPLFYLSPGWLHSGPQSVKQLSALKSLSKVTDVFSSWRTARWTAAKLILQFNTWAAPTFEGRHRVTSSFYYIHKWPWSICPVSKSRQWWFIEIYKSEAVTLTLTVSGVLCRLCNCSPSVQNWWDLSLSLMCQKHV